MERQILTLPIRSVHIGLAQRLQLPHLPTLLPYQISLETSHEGSIIDLYSILRVFRVVLKQFILQLTHNLWLKHPSLLKYSHREKRMLK